jgi:hypothetical protein
MAGPPHPHDQSSTRAIRRWLTGTLAGRTLITGAALKLIAKLAALVSQASVVTMLDTVADVTLVIGAILLARRLFTDLRGVLLWRVRRKLILSYIFIGFIPVLLVIVFFLTSGLILFQFVSQYVAATRIETLVEQAAFLAQSAGIGLQDAKDARELRERLARRQAGASRAYPFVSYAVVPVSACRDAAAAADAKGPADGELTAGPWTHAEPPRTIPDWLDCQPTSGLVAYTDLPPGTLRDSEAVPAHLVARAVSWFEGGEGYAVVVDVPLSAPLLAHMRDDTGIDYGLGDITTVCTTGLPLAGRSAEVIAGATVDEPRRGLSNPLTRQISGVSFLEYVDWNTGNIATTEVLEVNYGPVKFRHGGGFASYAVTTWTNQR